MDRRNPYWLYRMLCAVDDFLIFVCYAEAARLLACFASCPAALFNFLIQKTLQ